MNPQQPNSDFPFPDLPLLPQCGPPEPPPVPVPPPAAVAGIPVHLTVFAERAGIHPATVKRWAKQGWIKLTNVASHHYVFPEDLEEFSRRARAGEFAKESTVEQAAAAKRAGAESKASKERRAAMWRRVGGV